MDFAVSENYTMKVKKGEELDKYLDFVRELKNKKKQPNTMEQEGFGDTSYRWNPWNSPQETGKINWVS